MNAPSPPRRPVEIAGVAGVARVVRVGVANVWQRPDSPRPVDAPSVADEPDLARWLAQLDEHADESTDGEGRLGLHDRLETQLLEGEVVVVVGTDPEQPGWVQVRAPRQPTSLEVAGYPGWVRARWALLSSGLGKAWAT